MDAKKQRNILIIIIILLILGGGVAISRIGSLKTDLAISNQNNQALSDSIRVTKTKVGDLEYSKSVLVAEKGDLKDLNKNLSDELKKEKGRVSELNIIIGSISNNKDTVYVPNEIIQYPDSSYGLKWVFDKKYDEVNFRYLEGISKFRLNIDSIIPLETSLIKDSLNFNLVTGLKENEGKIEIFARSDYPGFSVVKLDGAIIDPSKHPVIKKFTKDKKWGVGPYVGFGWSTSITPSVQLGVGVQYSLFKF